MGRDKSSLVIFLAAFLGWLLIMALVLQPLLLTALLAFIAVFQLAIRFSKTRFVFAIMICLIDSVWEMGMIRSGQYVYHGGLPSLGGMPLWLPVAWIVAGFALIELYEYLSRRMH